MGAILQGLAKASALAPISYMQAKQAAQQFQDERDRAAALLDLQKRQEDRQVAQDAEEKRRWQAEQEWRAGDLDRLKASYAAADEAKLNAKYTPEDVVHDFGPNAKLYMGLVGKTHKEAFPYLLESVKQGTGKFQMIPGPMVVNPQYEAPESPLSTPQAQPSIASAFPMLGGDTVGGIPITAGATTPTPTPALASSLAPTVAGSPQMIPGPDVQGPEIMQDVPRIQAIAEGMWNEKKAADEAKGEDRKLTAARIRASYRALIPSLLERLTPEQINASYLPGWNQDIAAVGGEPMEPITGKTLPQQAQATKDAAQKATASLNKAKFDFSKFDSNRDYDIARAKLKDELRRTGIAEDQLGIAAKNLDLRRQEINNSITNRGQLTAQQAVVQSRLYAQRRSQIAGELANVGMLLSQSPTDPNEQGYISETTRKALRAKNATLIAEDQMLAGAITQMQSPSSSAGAVNYNAELDRSMGKSAKNRAQIQQLRKTPGVTEQQIYEAFKADGRL